MGCGGHLAQYPVELASGQLGEFRNAKGLDAPVLDLSAIHTLLADLELKQSVLRYADIVLPLTIRTIFLSGL